MKGSKSWLPDALTADLQTRYQVCERTISNGDFSVDLMIPSGIDDLLERCEDADNIPFWSEIWPAAHGLGSFLHTLPDVADKTMLELGCGVGLVGLVAAALGADVTVSDYVADALLFAELNAFHNHLTLRTCLGDWRNWSLDQRFQLVVGADILYEPTLHEALLTVLDRTVASDGRALLADPGRDGAERFLVLAEKNGWGFADIEEYQVQHSERFVTINVLTLIPPP